MAYNVVAGGAMVSLAVFSLAVARKPEVLLTKGARTILWVGAVVSGLRALIGVIGDVGLLLNGQFPTAVTLVADLWFTVAAALMLALLVAARRDTAGLRR